MDNTRYIVAGINTEVGKTYVSALLVHALNASYWKPIQCGLPRDAETIERLCNIESFPETYLLKTPCSPHLAARKEGVSIEAKNLTPPRSDRPLVIEGTGGILAPLNEREVWFDAAKHWQAKWILVHRHYLGSLNHFLLTLSFLERHGVALAAVVFNGEGDPETEAMLLHKAKAPCLRLP